MMKSFKPFAVSLAAVFAIAFACFAQASPSVDVGASYGAAVTQAHGVDYLYVTVQQADIATARVAVAVHDSPAVFTSHVMHQGHYRAVTRLALHVEDVPIVRRS